MSKAARKTRRIRRYTAPAPPGLTVIDFIYRRLTGHPAGFAPIGKRER